jgi:hypothetical protein
MDTRLKGDTFVSADFEMKHHSPTDDAKVEFCSGVSPARPSSLRSDKPAYWKMFAR